MPERKKLPRGLSIYLQETLNTGLAYTLKPVLSGHKIGFQYRLPLDAGQQYCRMLQGEHSAILSTFIKLPFPIKTLVLSIFKWALKTCFAVSV